MKKLVAAKVDDATAEIDNVLAEVTKQQIGTKLFAESDEQDSDDTGTVDKNEGGSNVLADPTGKTQGQLLVGKRKRTTIGEGAGTKRKVIKGLEKDKKAGKDVKIGMKTRKQRVVRVGGGSGSKAKGDLPRAVVQKYIRRKMGAIKACYQKGLQSNPSLKGKVVYDEKDPHRPRFSLPELRDILQERNALKAKVSDLEDELAVFRPRPPTTK